MEAGKVVVGSRVEDWMIEFKLGNRAGSKGLGVPYCTGSTTSSVNKWKTA